MNPGSGFDTFHPLVREWFIGRYGGATAVQAETWSHLASGGHVLALAPTGSGKTLAAFLHAISCTVSGAFPAGGLSVLYVSPLKALNEDVRRNLETPLAEIALLFQERRLPMPEARVETRSGDTPQSQRRRFLAKPPSILCTTPESLALLLDSPRARPILAGVRLVILDELHAVAGSKRGSLLACSVGRLALLAGEFQRVALSATLRPLDLAARYVGGREAVRRADGSISWTERDVSIVAPSIGKRIDFLVEWPASRPKTQLPGASDLPSVDVEDATRYDAVIPAIAARIAAVRSVLLFTDSRRRAERIAWLLNEEMGEGTAYAHHGSLAREARLVVEERFKAGELKCVVATASLELGIDMGSVDEVILAGSPNEVNAALQRAGRSGHGVGFTSTAVIFPFHGMDLLRAAAVVEGAEDRDVESIRIPQSPLDILAQVLLSMAAERGWKVDELYETILSFPPFERLARTIFDSTLDMLGGRFAIAGPDGDGAVSGAARLRELEPRVFLDRVTGTVRARDGIRTLLYSSGGAIPDRGHYSMRLSGSGTRIGELDEEFVYERKLGDAFTLGAQSWRIVKIGAEAVEVLPLGKGTDFIPFWRAESLFRSGIVSDRLLGLLDRLSPAGGLDREAAEALLVGEFHFSAEAARVAASFVAAQAAASCGGLGRGPGQGLGLPGRHAICVEAYTDPSRKSDTNCVVIHTLRGGGINEPLALALASAFEESGGIAPDVISDDDFVLLIFPSAGFGHNPGLEPDFGGDPREGGGPRVVRMLRSLGPSKRLESLVRGRLEGSGLFGAQFRENAGRALLIPRGGYGKRIPLWMTRLRSKRLFEAVRGFPDFPITAETWRSCLVDLFDMPGLAEFVDGIATSRIEVHSFASRIPSPFAREAIWRETGEYMYRGDALLASPSSSISDEVIKAALASSRLRPRLDEALVEGFSRKARRLIPGWGPASPFELAEWAKEAVLLPLDEVEALMAAGAEGLREDYNADPGVGGRLVRLSLGKGGDLVLVHVERKASLERDPLSHVAEWLRRQGPVPARRIEGLFGLTSDDLRGLLSELEEGGEVVVDQFRAGSKEVEVLDAENLEILLRLSRKAARPDVAARPSRDAFSLVARLQGLGDIGGKGLSGVLDSLAGYPLPLRLWEGEILPLRLSRYAPQDIDAILAAEPRLWFGAGKETVAFCRADELELFGIGSLPSRLLDAEEGKKEFWAIKEGLGMESKAAALALWKEAWTGLCAGEGFEVLRKGMRDGFGKDLPEFDTAAPGPNALVGGMDPRKPGFPRRIPRALRERWRSGAPVAGRWFSLELPGGEVDALDEEELNAARIRIVAERYGLLTRALLEREPPPLRFGSLFSAMRRMELRGELLCGHFFEGLEGPQFMTIEAFELFNHIDEWSPLPALWLCALDPAAAALSLASRTEAVDSVQGQEPLRLPGRILGNRFCVLAGRVVALLLRSGRQLVLAQGLEPESAATVIQGLAGLRSRTGKRLCIETVNGEKSANSPWAGDLAKAGFESDRGRMSLW